MKKMSQKIDFRKGTGTFVLGWYMMLMCLFIAVVLIDQYAKYDKGLQTQMAVDSIADGSAAYATSIADSDDDAVEDEVYQRAEEIGDLIVDETSVNEIYDYNYLVEYGNYQVVNNNHEGTIDATIITHNPNTYGNFADLFNVDDGDLGYYPITRHTTAYFSRIVGATYATVTEEELSTNHIHYNQYDTRWGAKPYYYSNTNRHGWNSIAASGCGPTSLAMIATELKRTANGGTISAGDVVTPDEVADFASDHGCHVGSGTSHELFTNNSYLSYFGLNGQKIPTLESNMKEALDRGSLLAITVGSGMYTSNGHFMVICEYDDTGFLINDPNYNSTKPYRVDFSYLVNQGHLENVFELWYVG